MSEKLYIHDGASDSLERERLELMANIYDEASREFIADSVCLDGAKVLEVGAGTGGIARWFASQVGSDGHVVATDIDLRFLTGIDDPRIEVREHNVVTDPIDETFDVVHGRFVLTHLFKEAPALIEKLAAVLEPGGCVIFEEADYGTGWAADRDHPRAVGWNEASTEPVRVMRELGAIDAEFGRRLPPILRASTLGDVRSRATYDISTPGSDYHRFHELSLRSNRSAAEQVPELDLRHWDTALEALADDTFHFGQMTVVRAAGYSL